MVVVHIILKNGQYLSCDKSICIGAIYLIDPKTMSFELIISSKKIDGGGSYAFADFTQNPMNENQIICIREEHSSDDKPSNVQNCLVSINIKRKTNCNCIR